LALDVYKDWLGIPDGPRPPDHYQLLRLVQFEDSVDRIRANYKKLNAHVRKYATGQYIDESQALLNEMAKAMLCLTDLERKREYDQSQGREFEEDTSGPKTMDVILLEQKHVNQDQVKQAKEHAERAGLDLRDAFVQLKLVDSDIAAQALAQELGLPFVDLAETVPDDDVLDRVPRTTVRQHSILPLFIDEGVVLIAAAHHIDHELEDELRLRLSLPVRSVLAAPQAITQAIAKYYSPAAIEERAAQKARAEAEEEEAADEAAGKKSTAKKDKDAGKSKKPEPARKEKPRRRGPKTAEELQQQKQIGIVVVNFSFLVTYLLDAFVITPNAKFDPLWLYAVIPGITALIVWQTLWQK
jgi:hypothetical protein